MVEGLELSKRWVVLCPFLAFVCRRLKRAVGKRRAAATPSNLPAREVSSPRVGRVYTHVAAAEYKIISKLIGPHHPMRVSPVACITCLASLEPAHTPRRRAISDGLTVRGYSYLPKLYVRLKRGRVTLQYLTHLLNSHGSVSGHGHLARRVWERLQHVLWASFSYITTSFSEHTCKLLKTSDCFTERASMSRCKRPRRWTR